MLGIGLRSEYVFILRGSCLSACFAGIKSFGISCFMGSETMEKFVIGVSLFMGAGLVFFAVYLLSGGSMEIVLIAGLSLIIAMLGVILINQRRELDARKRAEKRRELNRGM